MLSTALAGGCTSDGLTTGTASFAPGAASAAIVGEGDAAEIGAMPSYDDNASYAGRATYSCDSGETLQVDNALTRVALGLPDGSVIDLPASPADSHTRYVNQQVAFVLDGEEALFFRPKTAPATCRRG